MFYCDKCREKLNWPVGVIGSHGKCEVCGKVTLCNDVPSSELPPRVAESKQERTFNGFTPLHLELMLHYYTSPESFYRPSEAAAACVKELISLELLEETDETEEGLKVTKRGEVFVNKLCSTELPKQVWI